MRRSILRTTDRTAGIDLIDLGPFVSVVDHGSVVAAAADQLAITRTVQNLEDAL